MLADRTHPWGRIAALALLGWAVGRLEFVKVAPVALIGLGLLAFSVGVWQQTLP